jgi:hypothetical protein
VRSCAAVELTCTSVAGRRSAVGRRATNTAATAVVRVSRRIDAPTVARDLSAAALQRRVWRRVEHRVGPDARVATAGVAQVSAVDEARAQRFVVVAPRSAVARRVGTPRAQRQDRRGPTPHHSLHDGHFLESLIANERTVERPPAR